MSETTRMMIVEAIGDEQAREICNLLDAHAAVLEQTETAFIGTHRLAEEGGGVLDGFRGSQRRRIAPSWS